MSQSFVEIATDSFVEIATDCYGTPPAEIDRVLRFWPGGIDFDLFADPKSALPARDGFDVRRGQDAYTTPVPTGLETVHGNGPFSGSHPRRTAELFADLHRDRPELELLNLTICAPGLNYWRTIWQTANAVAFLGRLSYVALRVMTKTTAEGETVVTARPGELQDGNRNEAATAFYGPPERTAAFLREWGKYVPTVPCHAVRAPRRIIDMSTATQRTITSPASAVSVVEAEMGRAAIKALIASDPPLSMVRQILVDAGAWPYVSQCGLGEILDAPVETEPTTAKPKAKVPKSKAPAKRKAPPNISKVAAKGKKGASKAKAPASRLPSVSEETLKALGKYIAGVGVGGSFTMREATDKTELGKRTVIRGLEHLNGHVKRTGVGPKTHYEVHSIPN